MVARSLLSCSERLLEHRYMRKEGRKESRVEGIRKEGRKKGAVEEGRKKEDIKQKGEGKEMRKN